MCFSSSYIRYLSTIDETWSKNVRNKKVDQMGVQDLCFEICGKCEAKEPLPNFTYKNQFDENEFVVMLLTND